MRLFRRCSAFVAYLLALVTPVLASAQRIPVAPAGQGFIASLVA